MKTVRMSDEMMENIQAIMHNEGINFTEFVTEAMENYIRSIKFNEEIEKSFGCWEKNTHTELKNGIDNYIRKMRKGRKL